MKEIRDDFFISLGTVDHNFAPMYCSNVNLNIKIQFVKNNY